MKALERSSLLADRAAVQSMLERLSPSDSAGRRSFQSRLAEIDEQLEALENEPSFLGTAALIFDGAPVLGSRSIEASFASDALSTFEDLVRKRVAAEEVGDLAGRGPLPGRAKASVGITGLVRGSVGFLLEEQPVNYALADTLVKRAMDDVVSIIRGAGSEDEQQFESAMERIDGRFLVSLRKFFETLDDNRAQARIVDSEHESRLDTNSIQRARVRLDQTRIQDRPNETVIGKLIGLLPDKPAKFTMLLREGWLEIRGSVVARVADQYRGLLDQADQRLEGRWWRARMDIREVYEPDKPVRRTYLLLGLEEEVPAPNPPREAQ